ncbi:phage holin family protein [Gordonia sp. OPL2]|uniref:phage holin family protein n=1 Tax=Gordonia sp. OPL2 TaxID=2486274 RepID=UPI0016554215|nr:phage holin family protein [Gordonia sp. OPL2]ROZ98780.1 phage holin family protein [Gordonia sp. OPL2]
MGDKPADDLSTVQLVERLQQQTTTLVRTEIRDALDEVKTKGTRLGIGIGISGAGALLLFFGLATFVAAAVIGLANAVDAWLAAVIVGAALLVVGGIAAAIGAQRAKAAVPPAPEHTVASVQRDVDTVKEHLR